MGDFFFWCLFGGAKLRVRVSVGHFKKTWLRIGSVRYCYSFFVQSYQSPYSYSSIYQYIAAVKVHLILVGALDPQWEEGRLNY